MKRTRVFLLLTPLTLVVFAACSGDGEGGGGRDASVALPDANVVLPSDGGILDATTTPTVSAVSPRSGSEAGGTRVTIRGRAFLEPAQVFFGDRPASSVVVLDEVSIAATTPPNAPGPVTVKVETPGGIASRADAFRYHRELVLTAVSPVRVPEEGGVPITIIGKGFDADTLVLFDRRPLIGSRLVDAEHIEGFVPALAPGRPEIRVMHREAEVRRSDLLTVFSTPEVRALAPGFGPIAGSSAQALEGEGFTDTERVLIGGAPASGLAIDSAVRLEVASPPLAEGVHDVRVENRDASGALAGGYVAFDPAATGFAVVGLSPRLVSARGGDLVSVVGHGLAAGMTVTIGGVAAPVAVVTPPNVITVRVPAGLPLGPQAIAVTARGPARTATLAAGLETFAPISVSAIAPAVGPAGGGTEVTITGAGFTPDVEVRVGDVPLEDVTVRSTTELTGRTRAGAHGSNDITVRSPRSRGVLAGGFRYEEPFALIRVEPSEGSLAGNTYVSVFGRGIDDPVGVSFGAAIGRDPVRENGSIIGVRTLPSMIRRVDVTATTGGGEATFRDAYAFYDPKLITGGAWGGPIEGSVNVAVVDPGSGRSLPNMVVQLGYDADPRYRAITDQNGLATISSPEIRGAQTITAGQNGFEFVTFTDLDARNLTLFSGPHPASPPPDAPLSPCPTGAEPPVVKGKVFRVKSSLDPVTSPGWVPVVRVTYSQANVFSPNPGQPTEQTDFVFEDGGEFQIVTLRAGTVAVYGILYDYNQDMQLLIPRRMGIARQVPAAPGSTTEGVELELNIELDQQLTVRLEDAPRQTPGPGVNAVFPFLNLGSEGVIPFQAAAIASGPVVVEHLPNLAASQFFYMGGAFTSGPAGGLGAPYSLTLYESGEPFDQGLELGPFLQMPENVTPKPGAVLRGGRFAWDQAGPTPDITTIAALDVATVEGCCCVDVSQNGVCEPGEPPQCGGFPQFTRWSLYGRGGLESYVFPRMPSGVNAFEPPNEYAWSVQEALAPRFDWREFVYNQFSPFFWTSWNVWGSTFVSKEETLPP